MKKTGFTTSTSEVSENEEEVKVPVVSKRLALSHIGVVAEKKKFAKAQEE